MQQVGRREWLRAVAQRALASTRAPTAAPVDKAPSVTTPTCTTASPWRCVSVTSKADPAGHEPPAIPHLPPGFGVERCLIEHHPTLFLRLEPLHVLTVAQEGGHRRLAVEAVVADEGGRTADIDRGVAVRLEPARSAGAGALPIHRTLERRQIDGQQALARNIRSQVHGESVSVVELEHRLAGDHIVLEPADGVLENTHPLVEGPGELLFFLEQDSLDLRATPVQLRDTHRPSRRRAPRPCARRTDRAPPTDVRGGLRDARCALNT